MKSQPPAGAVSAARADSMIAFLRDHADRRLNSRMVDERRCLPPYIVQELGRAGLLGLQIEAQHGGQALTFSDTLRVVQQTAAIDPNLTLLVSVQNAIGIPPIQRFAREPLRAEALPLLASGRALATIAASEREAGANFKAIASTARRLAGGNYLLNGDKFWISLGLWSEYVSVFAQLEDEQGQRAGMTGFLVRRGTAGFMPGAEVLTYGMRGIPQNEITMRDLRVTSEALLGAEGQGTEVAQAAFMLGRIYVGANSLGAMKRCLQIATRYAQRRTVATGNLFDNGLTHQIVNDCVAATRSVELLVAYIGRRLDDDGTVPDELCFVCKALAAELMWKTVDRCVQMMGGRGFLDTNVVGQFFRDYRLLRIFEGPTEAVVVYLGTVVLKDEGAFLRLLAARFDTPGVVQKVDGGLATVRDLHAPRSGEPPGAQDRHVAAAAAGDLACWGTLCACTMAAARASGAPTDEHAARWCEQRLDHLLRNLHTDYRPKQEMPASRFLADAIAGYASTIGDTEQSLTDEFRSLDGLVRRDG